MENLKYIKKNVNLAMLDEELRAVLSDKFLGLSRHKEQLTIHLADKATAAETAAIEQQLAAHDATKRSAAQQKQDQKQAELAKLNDDSQWDKLSVEEKLDALRWIIFR